MITLKNYQQTAMDTLRAFLTKCQNQPVSQVYAQHCLDVGIGKSVYNDYFNGAPSVCLRVPTGGGKTLMAVAALKVIDESYRMSGAPTVVWLTPSDTITTQTFNSLSNPEHPYRKVLDSSYKSVKVCDLDSIKTLSKADFDNSCVVLLSTIQAFNVASTSSRKVYAFNEDYAPFFIGRNPSELDDLERVTQEDVEEFKEGVLKHFNVGAVKYSLANLLHLTAPIVIVDEAHNNRTDKFFTTLNRLNPSAVLELTATPQKGNNVIYQVSAWELKAENMIKLPVILGEHTLGWEHCIDESVMLRAGLEKKANHEKDYVRPIVLIQAQPKNLRPQPDEVKQYLIDHHHIDESQIAIATGAQKDLNGVDLFSNQCPVRFVITVEALKEGWDCSFAYVLCGLQNIQSSKDIEQLLGRILRMPYAKQRNDSNLSQSYANIVSEKTMELAYLLRDRIVSTMGFSQIEANDLLQVVVKKPDDEEKFEDDSNLPLFKTPVTKTFRSNACIKLKNTDINETISSLGLNEKIRVEHTIGATRYVLSVRSDIQDEELDQFREALFKKEDKKTRENIEIGLTDIHTGLSQHFALENQTTQFTMIPLLCYCDADDDVHILSRDSAFDSEPWNPIDYQYQLPNFNPSDTIKRFALDIDETKSFQDEEIESRRMLFGMLDTEIKVEHLIKWLTSEVKRNDVISIAMHRFVSKVVNDYLIGQRHFTLAQLVQYKVPLVNAIKALLDTNYKLAVKDGFQGKLNLVCETPSEGGFQFLFEPGCYSPTNLYVKKSKSRQFKKHFYPVIHDLQYLTEKGAITEEYLCAEAIDKNINVSRWVRNVERGDYSFYLPTSSGRFYPDFVVELKDGRILVIEYKGENLKTNDDTREKVAVGQSWEKANSSTVLFLLATRQDEFGRNVAQQIAEKIENRK